MDVPFIVSLYKYIVLVFCFFVLVGVGLAVFTIADPTGPMVVQAKPYLIASLAAFLVFFVLGLGATAILLSVHDRHREIAAGIDRIASTLEARERNDA
jgi:hypothetical protein